MECSDNRHSVRKGGGPRGGFKKWSTVAIPKRVLNLIQSRPNSFSKFDSAWRLKGDGKRNLKKKLVSAAWGGGGG